MALGRAGTMKLLDRAVSLDETSRRRMFFLPSSIFLSEAVERVAGSNIMLGSQGCSVHDEGAFTGEISAKMIAEVGADFVMVGHFEQVMKGETLGNSIEQSLRATEAGLKVLFCIGEATVAIEPRELGDLKASLDALVAELDLPPWVIAYEPHWAIGERGSLPDLPYLRLRLESLRAALDERGWRAVPVVYGGSVNAANATEIDGIAGCDGLFVGRAAWAPEALEGLVNLLTERGQH